MIYFWQKLASIGCQSLWFDSSHIKKYILGCHLVAQSLGENIYNILPALHSISCCDTISRLHSKKQCLIVALLNFVQNALAPLRSEYPSAEQLKKLEKVCTYLLFKKKKYVQTADELQYKLIS